MKPLPFILLSALPLQAEKLSFTSPKLLKNTQGTIRSHEPACNSPAWGDVTGDKHPDLILGEINGGRIRIYPGNKNRKLGEATWLQTDGKIAEVPGIC